MTDIVKRAREGLCEPNVVCEDCRMLREAIDEIERLRARLETVRHEAQAATKLVLEHQSKNCHLHAEIEGLRAALRIIADMRADDDGYHAVQMAREALGDG